MLQTTKSNPAKPVRVLIYGPEGVGKSTFGAKADAPVFITPEGGIDQLTDAHGNPCEALPGLSTWDNVREAVQQLTVEQHKFKTLVIDSADWVERLAHAKIIGNSGKDIIRANGGYGAGYRESERMHRELIESLSALREKKDMNIIVTAHTHVKPVKDPSMLQDFDQHEIKCHEFVSSLWREWVDALFFARFNTYVKTSDESTKGRALSDGKRTVYTTKQPSFQAKNRYGLEPEIEFTENFWSIFWTKARKGPDVLPEISTLITKIEDKETVKKVEESVAAAGKDQAKLVAILNRLKQITGKEE